QLRAKADTQHRLAGIDGGADEALLFTQPRILRLLVGAHWAAHDDQPVEIGQWRKFVIGKQAREAERMAAHQRPGLDAAEPFEGDMLEVVNTLFHELPHRKVTSS